ncbi:MAG: dephospho-CoA kinase [Rhodoferax sp.]|nr:dephospho-CoA kinase [Rhodoferax sp.]MCF8209391.1 dephospho-CoA kinase [Rhodoferax sp.]
MAAVRLGLTGGIGSGKTTVAGLLAACGATVIDADAISRACSAANGAAIATLEATFGASILTAERALDREKMRTLAFSDPTAKEKLEAIIHPLVGQAIFRQAAAAQDAGARCIVFDIPLLVESRHWRQSLDRILVIDCPQTTQIARVVARSGLAAAHVEKMIAAQAKRAQRLAAADCTLYNEGISLTELEQQVQQLAGWFGL